MRVGVVIPVDAETVVGLGARGAALSVVMRSMARWRKATEPYAFGGVPPGHPWSKGEAVADAIGQLTDCDVLVVHDADVFTLSGEAMALAIELVVAGKAAWAVPHRLVHRLTRASTDAVLNGERAGAPVSLTRAAYEGIAGGGIVVLRTDVYLDCPIDPRFVGWGSEDVSWGWALRALHGPPWRGETDLIHLWHPHPAPNQRRSPLAASEELWRRYRAFRDKPVAMRGLVDQASAAAFAEGRPVRT